MVNGEQQRDEVRVFKDEGGEWRWHRVAPNGEKVATSGEPFDSFRNAHRAAQREAGDVADVVLLNGEED